MLVLFISIFAGCAVVFPFHLITMIVTTLPPRQEKAKQLAISKGQVITAVLVRRLAPTASNSNDPLDRVRRGIYVFEYNGKKYKYRLASDELPYKLDLYYLYNPRDAALPGSIVTTRVKWWRIYLLAALIALLFFA